MYHAKIINDADDAWHADRGAEQRHPSPWKDSAQRRFAATSWFRAQAMSSQQPSRVTSRPVV
jgi:hypothetical protein